MPKHLFFLLIAALLLAACAVAVPRPGELVYLTTFDAYNADWEQFQGRLEAQIGGEGDPELRVTVDDPDDGTWSTMNFRDFSDFDLVVAMRQAAGDDFNSAFGVVFRYQDRENFHVFYISGDGYYLLERRVAGRTETLSDWPRLPHPAVRLAPQENTVRVVAQGSAFTFLVNDQVMPLCLASAGYLWNIDGSGQCCRYDGGVCVEVVQPQTQWLAESVQASGKIGLAARTLNFEGGITVAFDNLILCGPQAEPPVPFVCQENSGS